MTLNELAAAAGVSKMAVSKNKKIPRTVNPDGTLFFDPSERAVQEYINAKNKMQRVSGKKQTKPKPAPHEPAVSPPPRRPAAPSRPTDQDEEEGDSPLDLDAAFMRVKIEEKTITNAARRGELIPRDVVRQYIQRIYAADTTELDQLGDRLAGKIAGEARGAPDVGAATVAVLRILSAESTRIKNHVQRVQKDFARKYPEDGAGA